MVNLVLSESGVTGTKFTCPKCGNQTGRLRKVTDESKKNFGKHFLNCFTTNDGKPCGAYCMMYENLPKVVDGAIHAKSFGKPMIWKLVSDGNEDDVVEVQPTVGQKRTAQPAPKSAQPPEKKPALAAPQAQKGPSPGISQDQLGIIISTHLKGVSQALKTHITFTCNELATVIQRQEATIQELKEMLVNLTTPQEQQQQQPEDQQLEEQTDEISQGANFVTDEELNEIASTYNY